MDRRLRESVQNLRLPFTTAPKGGRLWKKDGKGLLLVNAEGKTWLRIVPSVAGT